MKFYIKNQILKYVMSFVIMLILISCYEKLGRWDSLEILDILFGNSPLVGILQKTGCIVLYLWVQFVNAEIYLYYLKNRSYFSVRLVSDKKLILMIFVRVIINLFACFIVFYFALIVVNNVISVNSINILSVSLAITFIKGFGMIFIFSCIQMIFLILAEETKAFIGELICIVIFTYMNFLRVSFSFQFEIARVIFIMVFYIALSLCLIKIVTLIYRREKKIAD